MITWQHAWISVDPAAADDHAKLEAFGADGWELVSVVPWGSTFILFFKRSASPERQP